MNKTTEVKSRHCPCGSNYSYHQCCQPYIDQLQTPQTAEKLMRSRFSAYQRQNFQYLIDTHHNDGENKPLSLSDFEQDIQWIGLKIINTLQGDKEHTIGTVEFVAFYQSSQSFQPSFEQLHEKSFFSKIDQKWFYHSGTPLSKLKLARNEPCFCLSGKKYKKCHGY